MFLQIRCAMPGFVKGKNLRDKLIKFEQYILKKTVHPAHPMVTQHGRGTIDHRRQIRRTRKKEKYKNCYGQNINITKARKVFHEVGNHCRKFESDRRKIRENPSKREWETPVAGSGGTPDICNCTRQYQQLSVVMIPEISKQE